MHSTLSTLHFPSVRLFASAKSWIEGEALRQLYATSKLEGMRLAVGFPDLHPGKGSAVGAAFVTEGLIYPYLIGGDIGCGMALFKTDLVRSDAKLDRWAQIPFDLEHVWTDEITEVLSKEELESTDYDEALGTLGGGNHFAELQAVEEVLNAREFKKLGLGRQQLVVLVHSGSRGLGESILRDYVAEHQASGADVHPPQYAIESGGSSERSGALSSITLLSINAVFFRKFGAAIRTASGRAQQPRLGPFQAPLPRETRSFFFG